MSKRRRYQRSNRHIAEMNVVPYIDVMLILLIIFMITTPLLTEGIKVELPKTLQTETVTTDKGKILLITVTAQGDAFLQDEKQAISPQAVIIRAKALSEKYPDLKVYVKGDKNALYGKVLEIFDALKNIGIPQVSLITQKVKQEL